MPRSYRRRRLPSTTVLLPETSPSSGVRNPRRVWVSRARGSSSVPASSSVFSYCAPRPNIATDKSWGRSPKPPRSQGILGAGVFLSRCSEFRNCLPRFILGNPRPAAQRCKPLITQQAPGTPTGLRHPGRRRLPSSALLLLGPPFAFHFPLTAPQRPTLRAMDRGVGSRNAT